MDRREFVHRSAAAALAATAGGAKSAQAAKPKKALLKVGTQHSDKDDVLRIISSLGVNNICSELVAPKLDEKWSVESLTKTRERVESHGIQLDMIQLPLSSGEISRAETPSIMLAGPTRDQDIDNICQMIRNTSKAGIPAMKYNMNILGIPRTESVKGRGAAMYAAFDYSKLDKNAPLTVAGKVTAEMSWDRITYFLKRVVPVAEEYKVKLACHPHDPAMPKDIGYRGVIRVLGTVDGLKRFVSINPSKYHGLNFCQGTVSEMLENPNKEIFDVIRYFGTRGKIFNVHFRNIKGGFLNFQEVFPDNGDVDFIKAIRLYKEVGYDGMLMPDHVPKIAGDAGNRNLGAADFRVGGGDDTARWHHLGQDLGGNLQHAQQLVVPTSAMDVEEQRARCIGVVGRVRPAPGQLPDQPAIDGAKRQIGGAVAQAAHVVEQPAQLGAGEIGIDHQSRRGAHCFFEPVALELLALLRGTAVLPDDGAVDRTAAAPIPDDYCLALIGDADRGNILSAC
jgi:mannonate dehydratase